MKEERLLKSTSTVGLMTFVSRILGFIRDMVIAHVFGAGPALDAFLIAFKIPNFMRRLFAEGAFSQAFVPLLSEYRVKKDQQQLKDFINHVSGCLFAVLVLVVAIGMMASPIFISIFAPGFVGQSSQFELASDLLKITFPYILLISLTALSGGILNTFGKFAVPAFTPVFLNLSMIGVSVLFGQYFDKPILALAWGVFLGGIIQLSFQIPVLLRLGLLPTFRFNFKHPGVRRVLILMLPALVGVSVHQINALVDTVFASFLAGGSISWLYYADRLMEFPLALIGVAIATVILPTLSRSHVNATTSGFSLTLDWALRWLMLAGLPAALGLFMLAGPILATLFYSGAFDSADVMRSQECLMAYSGGILALMLVKVLSSGFYAQQNIKTPVKIAFAAMLVNVLCNALFIGPLQHIGLALATTVSAWVNALLLLFFLQRTSLFQWQAGFLLFSFRLGMALIALGMVVQFTSPSLDVWLAWSRWGRILQLVYVIMAGFLAYLGTLWLSGLRPRHLREQRA